MSGYGAAAVDERVRELLGGNGLRRVAPAVAAAVRPRLVVTGYATVDLERAADDALVRDPSIRIDPPTAEPLLGARVALVRAGDGTLVALLEPTTEGRLAASLARFGEGPVVLYLVGDDGALARARAVDGLTLTRAEDGPLGRSALLLGGSLWGPHLIVAATSTAPASPSADSPAGTIAP